MPAGPAWHRRVVARADVAGAVVFVIPVLLGAYFLTGAEVFEYGMYGVTVVVLLPHIGPFLASLRGNPANLLLVLLFGVLGIATAAAVVRDPSPEVLLQAKGLAATAAWASIYVAVFSSVASSAGVTRLVGWIDAICVVIVASVYASALGHAVGVRFGEVIEFGDGSIRAFGPLGDPVSYILVLPVLTGLVAARPLMVGISLGALLLTATRGAALSLLVGVLVLGFVLASGRVRLRTSLRWVAVSAIMAALILASPAASVLMSRAQEEPADGAYSLRLVAIEAGIDVVRENPLLGVGFNRFGDVRQARAEDWVFSQAAENGLSRAANQFVQTATDGGLVALLVLLLFVVSCGRNALRAASWRHATPSLIASQLWLVGVLVGNQGALWILGNTTVGFFVFAVAGLAAAASHLARREQAAAVRSGGASAGLQPELTARALAS
jgi:hypothetical protein